MSTTFSERRRRDVEERPVLYQEDIVASPILRRILAAGRIIIGFTFVWAFIDKVFGLGYATPAERAWIDGGAPAQGFMQSLEGPTAGFFQNISGPWADWLFMIGLLGIGLTLITGMGARVGALAGVLMYLFMYGASLPVMTNPFLDDHITGALILLVIAAIPASWEYLGLGKMWKTIAPNYLR